MTDDVDRALGLVMKSKRKGHRPQTDVPTFWIWTWNGILDAPTPGFGREDATPPMLKMGIGVCR